MTWTAAKVREELPDVQVRWSDGKVYTFVVRGRLLRYASVRPFDIGSAVQLQYSWDTIAASLNSGKPLTF